jgi:uncharacterized protein
MDREKEIQNALSEIKDLVKQNHNNSFHEMKSNILDLTDLIMPDTMKKDYMKTDEVINAALKSYKISSQDLQEALKGVLRPYLKAWLDDNLPKIVREVVEYQVQLIVEKSKHGD